MRLFVFAFLVTLNTAWAGIDKIIVYKEERELVLLEKGEVVKSYTIRLSIANNDPLFDEGPKRLRGDNKTPVGQYKIIKKRTNTNFKKSLLINYPNEDDIKWGKIHGYTKQELGDLILIHGEPRKVHPSVVAFARKLGISEKKIEEWARGYFYPYFDWTNGCIAVNDFEMDEIFELIDVNTSIEIHTSKKAGMDRRANYHSKELDLSVYMLMP